MTTQAYQTPTVGVPVGRNPYVFTSSHTNGYTFVVVGSLLGAILVLYMAFRALLYVRSRLWVKKGANSDLWFDQKHGSAFFGSKNDSEKLLTYSDGSDLLVIDHQGSGSEASQSSQQGRSYRNALAGKTSRALMYVSPLEQYMNPSSLSPYTTAPSFMGLSFVSETPSMVNSAHPLLQSSTPSQSGRLIRPPSQYLDDLLGQ